MRLSSWLLLLLATSLAAAGTDPVVSDGSVVRVSADEPNLIEAADGRVSAFVFADDAFEASSDSESGVVYFQPLLEGARSGFVETIDEQDRRRRISLVLVAQRDFPAQRIVIGAAADSSMADAQSPLPTNRALPRNRQIKIMLRQLASTAPGADLVSFPVGPPRMLADGIEMTVIAASSVDGWQLQTALLVNPGAQAAVLRPADLAGRDRRVIAVASDVDAIAAGDSAIVYLVLADTGQGI
ncbi:MAG: type-F conjugative transfer system secretin TraK [Betaproteobacteria bacterium]|nr:type-F conjugative transfer system secretin TraK [Betaproteobacteria bacterium]